MTEAEKRKVELEKQVVKFHKKLGVHKKSQSEIDAAVLEFAKTSECVWGEIFLTEAQTNNADFMLRLFKSNIRLVNFYYFPGQFRNNTEFVLSFLELYFEKEKQIYKNITELGTYEYKNAIDKLGLQNDKEFLVKFAERFPECNIMEVVSRLVGDGMSFLTPREERMKALNESIQELPKHVIISQMRRFGVKALRYLPNDNPLFQEAVITGIECDGFKSLATLQRDMIYENRSLIVLAAKKDGIEGLEKYFYNTLSPRRSDSYMCHGELHEDSHYEFEYYPLRKALIEDDSLFDAMGLPKEKTDKLRAYVREDTDKFYARIRPYAENRAAHTENAAHQTNKTDGKNGK